MKLNRCRPHWQVCIAACLLFVASHTLANQTHDFSADEFWFDTAGTQIDVITPFEFENVELRVRKRGETEVWTEEFGPGVSLSADLAQVVESGLTDAVYTYEIRFTTGHRVSESDDNEAGITEEPIMFNHAGSFRVEAGSITDIKIPGYREPGQHVDNSFTHSDNNAGLNDDISPTHVVDPGNLAMGGWGVFGSSSTSDVVAGKLRILPSTTGISSVSVQSEASNGDDYAWHFGTSIGGDFGLQRQRGVSGSKITVLGIEEEAPSNSLMINSNGHVGIGTATPSSRLEVSGSEIFPEIRLRHTEAPDPVGIATDRQGRLRFRAPAGFTRMTVAPDGNVGIGTTSPTTLLHVRSSIGSAEILVEDTSGNSGDLLTLKASDAVKFRMLTNGGSDSWAFRTTGGGNQFAIASPEATGIAFRLTKTGNATFLGNVTANGVLLTSTREAKTDFAPLDIHKVLDRLASLEISQWRYKHEEEDAIHFGPIAEEFHEIFGLSDGKTLNMIDTNGIAFAAIQALHQRNQQLGQENQQIKAENESLAQRLGQIESQLNL